MPEQLDPRPRAPRFSVVSAVYNVAPYLPEFIESIEAQTHSLDDVEVILVDDGSTDGSADILAAWQKRRPQLVSVVRKPNGGQSSARNMGLEHARGEWVTFTDPDDMWAPDALAEIVTFLKAHPRTQMVAMKRVLLHEATGEQGRHPLHRHFDSDNRLRDLNRFPKYFHGSAPSAFFRLAEISRLKLRFRDDVKPSFEDGYFCCEYLFGVDAPLVGFVSSAVYVYRKRAAASSTLNLGRTDVRRYTSLLRLGYLRIMRESIRITGSVPGWLQNYIIYELSYFMSQEDRVTSPLIEPIAEQVNDTLREITELIDDRWIAEFTLRTMKPVWRDILAHGFSGERWHTPHVQIDRVDMDQRLLRVTYRYIGERPEEQFLVDGTAVEPVHQKVRSQPYFQRIIARHRVVWLPYGALEVRLAGTPVPVLVDEPEPEATLLDVRRARDALVPKFIDRQAARKRRRSMLGVRDRLLVKVAESRPVRRIFGNAWVLVDRLHDADDSAEHLFRHVRSEHPAINAWFVLKRGVVHDKRLRSDGFRRVVAPGTLRWKLLMLNCTQLISSHADQPIVAPKEIVRLRSPRWRLTFLQHGVIKDDLSSWLNPKKIDLFVASTPGEYGSLTADDTAYEYTSKEVKLTGLPRFDRVLAAGAEVPPEQRDLLLFAPTWRQWLVTSRGNQEWDVDTGTFLGSDFAVNWLAVIKAEQVRDLARREGLTLAVLMHPNLQAVVPALGLAADVKQFGFDDDVRQLFARARVLVTDYSSMAFNAAYIERPVVYFQFDRDQVLGGEHVGRRGYFDYDRDGFGPVTHTPGDAVSAIAQAVEKGPAPAAEHLARIAAAFPTRDGHCSERVTQAILESVRQYPASPADPA